MDKLDLDGRIEQLLIAFGTEFSTIEAKDGRYSLTDAGPQYVVEIKQLLRDFYEYVKPKDEVIADDYDKVEHSAYWSHEQAEGYQMAIDEMDAKYREVLGD